MTCPAGCLRLPGHSGFHTTVPAVAEREDKPDQSKPEWMPADWWPKEPGRIELVFVPAPWMPPSEAIMANRDGSSAVRIIGIGERGEENAIRAGRKMLELIEGLKENP